MFLARNHFTIDPDTHKAIAPLTGNQIPIILELNRSLNIIMNVSMVLLENKFAVFYKEVDSSTVVAKESTGRNIIEVFTRTEPEFYRASRHLVNQVDSRLDAFAVLERNCLATNTIDQRALAIFSIQFIEIESLVIHDKSRSLASECRIRHSITGNVRYSELVKRTRRRHCFVLPRPFHAAAGLITNHDKVFERNSTLCRNIPFRMFPTIDQFAIDPHTHVAVAPLTGNQVPIVLELNCTLNKEMLIVMIFLEIDFAILVEEMDSRAVVSNKGSCLLIVKVFIRAEPELDSTHTHGVNQIYAERSDLAIVQFESFTANALNQFTFVKEGFQLIEVTGILVHLKGGSCTLIIEMRRRINNRSFAFLRKGIKVSRDTTAFIDSGPHLLGIIFYNHGVTFVIRGTGAQIRFRTSPKERSHRYYGGRKQL